MRYFALLLIATIAVLTASAQGPAYWIRSHAVPLTTDMRPLNPMIGGARIVALGEATHGTREFFQLKRRMIEFLATQKGFTIFSIEANMPEAYRLNDFVLHGAGDPKQLLKEMGPWTWDTQEVLDMVLWMREFNRSGKGHIEFTGFDLQNPDLSIKTVSDFVKQYDPPYFGDVESAYREVPGTASPELNFGVATASFPVAVAAGKQVTFTGYIRTDAITSGYAGLWWRVDGEPGTKPLAFDNMEGRGAKGTTPWTRYEISLGVPTNARNINFGVLHQGSGTAWFDSLKVRINGIHYTGTSQFDLDFESASPRGFKTGGRGYEVVLDKAKEAAHTGNQGLRMMPKSRDNIQLTAACKRVRQHLESNRTAFEKLSNPKDVDWSIQSARLVVQYMQMQTGEQSRDESMAENVKWIADHSPGAKLVLWAHNGHVAHATRSTMGSYLRDAFGAAFINFGFAFDQGSFRAFDASNRKLREFTVGPAPVDTLDAALTSATVPIFALDLRGLPRQGPIADWFALPHRSRWIGAIYSDSQAASCFTNLRVQDAFDVILFVNKTTASRANQP